VQYGLRRFYGPRCILGNVRPIYPWVDRCIRLSRPPAQMPTDFLKKCWYFWFLWCLRQLVNAALKYTRVWHIAWTCSVFSPTRTTWPSDHRPVATVMLYFRPHRMHDVRTIATDVSPPTAWASVSLSITRLRCANTVECIEVLFGSGHSSGLKEHSTRLPICQRIQCSLRQSTFITLATC